MKYRASLDTPARLITGATIMIMAFLTYNNFFTARTPLLQSILVALLFVVIIAGGYLYAPSGYIVDSEILIIVRPVNRVTLPLASITGARLLMKDETGTMIRMCGSGGFFGYYGNFRSTRLGKLKLYTTRRNNRILITTDEEERWIITPDDLSILKGISANTR